jgi:hypothetical protein
MKEIIKEILQESTKQSIVHLDSITDMEIKRFRTRGLIPVVIVYEDMSGHFDIDAIETTAQVKALQNDALHNMQDIDVYILTKEQHDSAVAFISHIQVLIQKYFHQIQLMRELFQATLVQKIMKNDFPKKTDDTQVAQHRINRGETRDKAKKLLDSLHAELLKHLVHGDDTLLQQKLDAVLNSDINWEKDVVKSLREHYKQLVKAAQQRIR